MSVLKWVHTPPYAREMDTCLPHARDTYHIYPFDGIGLYVCDVKLKACNGNDMHVCSVKLKRKKELFYSET